MWEVVRNPRLHEYSQGCYYLLPLPGWKLVSRPQITFWRGLRHTGVDVITCWEGNFSAPISPLMITVAHVPIRSGRRLFQTLSMRTPGQHFAPDDVRGLVYVGVGKIFAP